MIDQLNFVLERCNHFEISIIFASISEQLLDFRITSPTMLIEFGNSIIALKFSSSSNSKTLILRNSQTKSTSSSNISKFEFEISKRRFISLSINKSLSSFDSQTFQSSKINDQSMNIVIIDAIVYYRLNFKKHQIVEIKCYFMIIFEIDDCLQIYRIQTNLKKISIEINEIDETFINKLSLNQVKRFLHFDFHDMLKTFDQQTTKKLFFHRSYDHKIELIDDFNTIRNRIYFFFYLKLLKLKKYLNENFNKDFINFSIAFYSSSMLFVIKFNENFRFCANYRKFNVIIKRNDYFILLIDETLIKLIECKYINKLNIIVAFNKLRMHFDSENLITFIIFLEVYKYHVLFFDLINELFNYQHYINNILFEYLNDFVQCYLNDVLIYNKTRKKHTRHVRLIFQKFQNAELQMNITKNCFYVQETSFLNVIVSIENIRMNFRKIQVIIE